MPRGKREGKVTQKVMVETALQEKGWDAGPQELQEAIIKKFGVEMPVNYISNYKSQIKHAAGKRSRRGGKGGGLQISDLETVRGLVNKLGADQVKDLIDMANKFV